MLKGKKFDAFALKGYERNFQRLKRTFTLWTSKNSMIRTS